MALYDFRLRFKFTESYRIESDLEKIELLGLDTGENIRLKSGAEGVSIKNHPKAAILGGSFASEAQARNAAVKSKRALLYWAVEQRIGIDFGDGKPRSVITDEGYAFFQKKYGCPIRNDVLGIDVYEHVDGVKFVGMEAHGIVGKSSKNFINTFIREYASSRQVADRLLLASEIYASSFVVDVSPRSRFITLVTAVEALLDQSVRSDEIQILVDEFETRVQQSRIDNQTKEVIIGQLSNLKRQSIREAGRALILHLVPNETFGGKSSVNFFADSYKKRGELLHSGKIEDESIDIFTLANEMESFVCRLLLVAFNNP